MNKLIELIIYHLCTNNGGVKTKLLN